MNRQPFLILVALLIAPVALALELTPDMQVVLGAGDRQTLADDFSQAQIVSTADANAGKDLLIIGGPCANPLWEQRTGMQCGEWPYQEGEGMMLFLDGAILVAGTTQQDTERLVNELFGSTSVESSRSLVADTSGGEIIITEGRRQTISTEEGEVEISGLAVQGGIVQRIIVDGEEFTGLSRGRSITTDDLFIRILRVDESSVAISVTDFSDDEDDDREEVTVREGEDERITIGGSSIDIEDLRIDDDTLDVVIDGERFTNLEEGDSDELDDVEFEVEDISDDEATFSFEENEEDSDELDEGDSFTIADGDDETVEVDGDEFEFTDASITNSTLAVRLDGTAYTNLMAGSIMNSGDVTFRVDSIDEDEADIEVDEIE